MYGVGPDECVARGFHATAVVTGIHEVPLDDSLLVGLPTRWAYQQSVHVRAGDRLRRASFVVGANLVAVGVPILLLSRETHVAPGAQPRPPLAARSVAGWRGRTTHRFEEDDVTTLGPVGRRDSWRPEATL